MEQRIQSQAELVNWYKGSWLSYIRVYDGTGFFSGYGEENRTAVSLHGGSYAYHDYLELIHGMGVIQSNRN
ncbi:hypothetical protein D3C73_1540590 [compost metagenome]